MEDKLLLTKSWKCSKWRIWCSKTPMSDPGCIVMETIDWILLSLIPQFRTLQFDIIFCSVYFCTNFSVKILLRCKNTNIYILNHTKNSQKCQKVQFHILKCTENNAEVKTFTFINVIWISRTFLAKPAISTFFVKPTRVTKRKQKIQSHSQILKFFKFPSNFETFRNISNSASKTRRFSGFTPRFARISKPTKLLKNPLKIPKIAIFGAFQNFSAPLQKPKSNEFKTKFSCRVLYTERQKPSLAQIKFWTILISRQVAKIGDFWRFCRPEFVVLNFGFGCPFGSRAAPSD